MLKNVFKKAGEIDLVFLVVVLLLTLYGLIMVYSASSPSAFYLKNDSLYYFKSQLKWTVIGLAALGVTAFVDYNFIKKMRLPIYAVSVILLVAVAVVGKSVNGAKRWLGFGSLSFQPSELVKISIVIMCAAILAQIKDTHWKKTIPYIVSCAIIVGICGIFLYFQPHVSVIIIIFLTVCVMMLASGIPLRIFLACGIPVAAVGTFIISREQYRVDRLISFTDPFKYKMDEGWQVVQSLYAIGSGGFSGVGLGRSRQKFLYIPEPQNDFIFSIICEELGFVGALFVAGLFLVLLWRGIKIALNAPDKFSMLLVFGLLSLVMVQTVLNIAVATSSVPPTGIPLPFFSAGGSSFVFQMISMGIILSISREPKIIIE